MSADLAASNPHVDLAALATLVPLVPISAIQHSREHQMQLMQQVALQSRQEQRASSDEHRADPSVGATLGASASARQRTHPATSTVTPSASSRRGILESILDDARKTLGQSMSERGSTDVSGEREAPH
jgi:hypothetical protein